MEPVRHEVVARYLCRVEPGLPQAPLAASAVALTRAYRRDLEAGVAVLGAVRAELAERGYRLAECRLLDIYLWAYSDTYEPLWRRQASVAPVSSEAPFSLRLVWSRFSRDDAGYVAWLETPSPGLSSTAPTGRRPATSSCTGRAACICAGRPGLANLTGAYAKVCASGAGEIDAWLDATLGVMADRCPACRP